jgi:phage shock protein A
LDALPILRDGFAPRKNRNINAFPFLKGEKPMSFFARLQAIFGAKANQALNQIEDPRAGLDYSLTRLQASLRQISDSLVEVSTARHSLEAQRSQAQKAVDQAE